MNTASPTSAPSAERVAPIPRPASPRYRQVQHLFWLKALKWASEHDLPIRSLCGFWKQPNRTEPQVRNVVGGVVEARKSSDCRNCARIYESNVRRQLAEGRVS